MIEYLQQLDTDLFLFLNSMHCGVMDRFMSLFTGRFIWIPMYVTLLYIITRHFRVRRAVMMVLGIVLAIVLADQLCATVLRPIFERLRPANLDNPISALVHIVDGYRGGRYSFPSCHAANSFALASFVWWMIRRPRTRLFIVAWALVTCYSRIYLGVHYPGDLLVGAVIGSLIGSGCYFLSVRALRFIDRHDKVGDEPALRFRLARHEMALKLADLMVLAGVLTTVVILIVALIVGF
ncbi:MAG: phosphatase PAP2 family protein [Muribaculaceae bacterium]|nr:phosphatase PAP2 family protein [Muribaculaceae bacterium]